MTIIMPQIIQMIPAAQTAQIHYLARLQVAHQTLPVQWPEATI